VPLFSHPHLPIAAAFRDRDSLSRFRFAELEAMLQECARWSVQAAFFRRGLSTPSSLVIWRVLVESEEQVVADAVHRLVDEMRDRLFSEGVMPSLPQTNTCSDGATGRRVP
jgi:hypothetical protein